MYYTIYKTTNLVNGKIYIGKHKTTNLQDRYLGSGKLFNRAVAKYGRDRFSKEILFIFTCKAAMDAKERELVTPEFCRESSNYNLLVGGNGGFDYIIAKGLHKLSNFSEEGMASLRLAGKRGGIGLRRRLESDPVYKERHTRRLQENVSGLNVWTGRRHKDYSKELMRIAAAKRIGRANSQFGTFWITNGSTNRKWRLSLGPLPEGFSRGRSALGSAN